jgi:hypothetical protein
MRSFAFVICNKPKSASCNFSVAADHSCLTVGASAPGAISIFRRVMFYRPTFYLSGPSRRDGREALVCIRIRGHVEIHYSHPVLEWHCTRVSSPLRPSLDPEENEKVQGGNAWSATSPSPNPCRICIGFGFSETLPPAASRGNAAAGVICCVASRLHAPCSRIPGASSICRIRRAPLRPCPPGTEHYCPSPPALTPPPRPAARGEAAPAATCPAQRAAREAAPLQASPPQQPLNHHHLPIPHLRFRG